MYLFSPQRRVIQIERWDTQCDSLLDEQLLRDHCVYRSLRDFDTVFLGPTKSRQST